MSKDKNKVVPVILGTVAATAATYAAACTYMFRKYFLRKNYTFPAISLTDDLSTWYDELPKIEVNLTSYDNYSLHGVKLVKEDKLPYVILVHGYGSSSVEMITYAKKYWDNNYNVLLIDQRGHGLSECEYTTFGWKEHFDLLNWISYLTDEDENVQIVLHGVSMGATTVLLASAEYLPHNVICAISDCAYTTLRKLMLYKMKKIIKINFDITYYGIRLLADKLLKFDIVHCNALTCLDNSETPTLFIHGELDDVVPFEMVFDLYYACGAKDKELVTCANSAHADSYLVSNYFSKVFKFIDQHK